MLLSGCRAAAPPPDPRTPRAEALDRAGDHGEAAALWFDIYLTSGRRDLDAGVAAGAAMLEAGGARNARALMAAVLADAPERADAHRVLGLAQATIGDRGAALATLRRAAELGPVDAALMARIGELEAAEGHAEAAIAALERARGLAPNDPRIAKALGQKLLEAGRLERALALLGPGLDSDAATDAERLAAARAVGPRREVVRWMRRIVERDPLHTEAQRRLGEALVASGRVPAGVAALEAAAQADPGDLDALLALAAALDLAGDRARARSIAAHAASLELDAAQRERVDALRGDLGGDGEGEESGGDPGSGAASGSGDAPAEPPPGD